MSLLTHDGDGFPGATAESITAKPAGWTAAAAPMPPPTASSALSLSFIALGVLAFAGAAQRLDIEAHSRQ